jgi:hypothetical protein
MKGLAACCAVVLLVALGLGCDSEEMCQVQSSTGKTYDCDADAPEKCDGLLNGYCDRVSQCSWFLSQKSCMAAVELQIDCDAAVAVSGTYQSCLSAIDDSSCSELEDGLPWSCEGAILTTTGGNYTMVGDDEVTFDSDPDDPSDDPPDDPYEPPDDPFDPPDDPVEPDPPTVWDYSYSVTGCSVTIAKYKPNDDNWDGFGGAPDVFLEFYVDGNYAGDTSTKQDTFDASWSSPGVAMTFSASSTLEIMVIDDDMAANDDIGVVTVTGSKLNALLNNGWVQVASPSGSIESFELSVMAQ